MWPFKKKVETKEDLELKLAGWKALKEGFEKADRVPSYYFELCEKIGRLEYKLKHGDKYAK